MAKNQTQLELIDSIINDGVLSRSANTISV